MKKCLLTLLLIGLELATLSFTARAAEPVIPESKQALIDQVQTWMAAAKQVDPSEIKVNAMDRRLRVPECAEDFSLSLPFPDQRTVRVECAPTGWSVLLGVEIDEAPMQLRFTRDLRRGERLQPGDVDLLAASEADLQLMSELGDRVLKMNVHQGQRVTENLFDEVVTVYALVRDLPKGHKPGSGDLRRVERAASEFPASVRPGSADIQAAVLSTDLAAGTVLRREHLLKEFRVRVADKLIPRGEAISPDNTRTEVRYGAAPADALPEDISRLRLVATSQIRPGEMVQMSQIRVLPEIVKGDPVTVTILRGRMQITAQLVAEEDAKLGNPVSLRNESSGVLVTGTVTGQKRAMIQ